MFISPIAMLDDTVTPDLLYGVGITLAPEQETALIGKLKLVLSRRIARIVWFVLSPDERRDVMLLSDYASRDAVRRWLEDHFLDLPALIQVEGRLLQAQLLLWARELQSSGGTRGIPDWSEQVEEEAA